MTEDLAAELLPQQSSTAYERANLGAQLAAWPLDVDAVRREDDPTTCALDKLPFLFFDRGGTLWNDAWPEAKQRAYVRDLWLYKRLEGTPLGTEAYLNLADGALIAEVLPPAQAFAIEDTGLTHQQVLDLMPQLRLYHHWPEQVLPYPVAFAGGVAHGITLPVGAAASGSVAARPASGTASAATHAGVSFAGASFLGPEGVIYAPQVLDPVYPDAAPAPFGAALFALPDEGELLGRYPVLFDPATGIETPLDVIDVSQSAVTVSLPRQTFAGAGFFAGVSACGQFLGPSDMPEPIGFDLADPAMETLRISPPMRAVQGAADARFAGVTYATNDLGDVGTFDRLYLYDGARLPTVFGAARAAAFAGVTWLGLPPYWQILTAAVPGTPTAVPQTQQYAGQAFAFDDADHADLDFAMAAIATAKRGGDRILVDLAPSMAGTRAATLPAIGDF